MRGEQSWPQVPVPRTSLIGRRCEIEATTRLLECDDVRLLTLTGPGGTGKTRLALAIAHLVGRDRPEGTCAFVDLSTIDNPDRVEARIAEALGVAEMTARPLNEAISVALGRVRLLLLDNCEHVLSAAMCVDRLLGAAPHVKILATSREAWHLLGEQEVPVAPLAVPDKNTPCSADVWRRRQTFSLREIGKAELQAGVDLRVLADQIFSHGLGVLVQRIVRGAHVGIPCCHPWTGCARRAATNTWMARP
jgi:predicted ATPase